MSESKKHDSLSAEELDGVAGGVFFQRDPSESFCPFCSMSTKDPKFKDTHLYLGEGEHFCEVECKTYPGDEIW